MLQNVVQRLPGSLWSCRLLLCNYSGGEIHLQITEGSKPKHEGYECEERQTQRVCDEQTITSILLHFCRRRGREFGGEGELRKEGLEKGF